MSDPQKCFELVEAGGGNKSIFYLEKVSFLYSYDFGHIYNMK